MADKKTSASFYLLDMFLRPWFSALCIGVLSLVTIAAWYSGRESSSVRSHQLTAELNNANYKLASAQIAIDQERAQKEQLERALKSFGDGRSALTREDGLRKRNLETDAIIGQYKALIKRQQVTVDDQSMLAELLSKPNVRLLTIAPEQADEGPAIGYVLLRERGYLMVFVSNLPQPSDSKVYCVWLERKSDPKIFRAGILEVNELGRGQAHYAESSLANFDTIRVTLEQDSNAKIPTGKIVLVGENDDD